MSTRAEIVARARDMYEDLDFGVARAWVEAEPGRKAIGMLPVYVPREVIHAAGMLPIGIHGGGDQLEIIRGDAYYQSYICHLPRSVVELALSGRLDFLSGVLFPSTCDVIRNLSGMWQLLRPEVYVKYVDLPHDFSPEIGGEFWRGEITQMMKDMGKIAGREVTEDDLAASIAIFDEARDLIRAIYAHRVELPWDVPTEELYLLMRAGEVMPVEDFIVMATDYLAAIKAEPGRPRDNSRVVVVGAFCEQPPLGLIKTIERAGCYVVDDDFLHGNRMLSKRVSPRIEAGAPASEALAMALLEDTHKSPVLYEPDPTGKSRLMPERAKAARADGIIFAAPSFCDPALLDRPMLRDGAEAAGIPCIAFKYAENTGQFQQFREQAGTFSDAIKLWSNPTGGA
jgi:benzoyl-CoA reductase subunit C